VASEAVKTFTVVTGVEFTWYGVVAEDVAYEAKAVIANSKVKRNDRRNMIGLLLVASYFLVRVHSNM